MTVLSLSLYNNLSEQRQLFPWKRDTQFTLTAWPQVKRIPHDPSRRWTGIGWIVNLNWSCSFLYCAATESSECWHSPFGQWLKSDGISSRAELDNWTKFLSNTCWASPIHQSTHVDTHKSWVFRKYLVQAKHQANHQQQRRSPLVCLPSP